VVDGLQSPLRQVDKSETVSWEAHEPGSVGDRPDAGLLTGRVGVLQSPTCRSPGGPGFEMRRSQGDSRQPSEPRIGKPAIFDRGQCSVPGTEYE
jgi:hypothetical protein